VQTCREPFQRCLSARSGNSVHTKAALTCVTASPVIGLLLYNSLASHVASLLPVIPLAPVHSVCVVDDLSLGGLSLWRQRSCRQGYVVLIKSNRHTT